MKDFPDEQLLVAGLRGPVKLEDILYIAAKSNHIAPLQVVRADCVVGAEHLRSAALHAWRAQRENRMQAKTIEVEFLRYLSGERQIKAGLAKMGVPPTAPGAVVLALGTKRHDAVRHFLHALGLPEDDEVWAASDTKLLQFGITPTQIAATTPGRRGDLVLEAVAAVDLLRP